LVEQPIRNRQVSGSSPLVGSILLSSVYAASTRSLSSGAFLFALNCPLLASDFSRRCMAAAPFFLRLQLDIGKREKVDPQNNPLRISQAE
jgi:hypothetical protein